MKEKITLKNFTMNVLNGIALGTVLCLVPGALLGELLKYIGKLYPSLAFLSLSITISNAMIGLASGIIIGLFFKLKALASWGGEVSETKNHPLYGCEIKVKQLKNHPFLIK